MTTKNGLTAFIRTIFDQICDCSGAVSASSSVFQGPPGSVTEAEGLVVCHGLMMEEEGWENRTLALGSPLMD